MDQALDVMVDTVRHDLGGSPGASEPPPRFELFHAPNSICSQKVRTVLAYHRIPHAAHTVNIFAGQTYLPSYVRLRLLGCARSAMPLAATHSGSTSASQGGCDAAVVPTLVDWTAGEVVVDSKRICLYLDTAHGGPDTLMPPALADVIERELSVVDNLPNYQMLMGKPPQADDGAPARGGGNGPGFSLKKVERCDGYLAQFADDEDLVQAYTAKRAKEMDAANRLFSPDAMRSAYLAAETECRNLDDKLGASGTPWLFGQAATMADLFWMVELLRMKNMGAAGFWEAGRLPRVARFVSDAEGLPAIRTAILDWPGALF